jgi:PKD repeat protein
MAINDPSYVKNIRNNIVSVTRDGSSSGALRYGMYYQDAFRMVSDYNLLNVNAAVGTNVAVYQNGTNYNTIGAWKASNSNSFDQNSFSANPQFVNIVSNVTPTSCAVNNRGVAITGITTDISGATRGTVPDPGAFEFNAGGANDAGISGLVNPGGIYCAGSQTVSVKLKNFGTATLTSATINWVIGGTGQTPFSWTGSLAPGAETTVNIGTYNFPASPVSFSTYTTSPNGSSDACNFNDTMVMPTVQAGLAGAYTIDPLGSGSTNFINFATAVTALQQRGVCSAVTFNVAAGTYNEQVILTPVSGASATNTITFNGGTGNAATRILQFPTSSNGYGHVDLNGADFITFKNMTLKSYVGQTSGYYGVLVRNQADNNIIDSCVIDMGGLTSITTSNMGIVMSGSQFSYTTSGNHGSNNIFRGNLIKGSATGGAYYGISIYPSNTGTAGTLNNKIIGNTIQDFYNYGIYTYYASGTLVSGNDISRPNRTAVTTIYGIYGYYDDYAVYENNSIHDPFTGAPTTTSAFYGIRLYNNSGGSGPVKAINNKLYNMNSNGSLYPIYVEYEQNMLIAHNSISMDHTTSTSTSTSYGIYFYYANVAATPATIKNNIISITRGGTGTKYAMYLQYYYFISDNNIIHLSATNASMGYYYGYRPPAFTTLATGTYTTLALWKTGQPGMDVNSVALNPTFTNAATGNLTPTNTSANNVGSATSVTLDINGNPRHPTTPDPGAYEWGPACSGTPAVFGVTINNGGSPVCNGSTVVLTAQYDFVSGLTFQWQESTNGTSYTNITGATNFSYTTPPITSPMYYRCIVTCTTSTQSATTSAVIVNTGMSGAYTINPSGSGLTNFTNFTAAINAMNTFGICGPVTFTVSNGTYPGRIVIPQVLGASATNTVTFDGGSGNVDNVVITEAFTTTPITSYAIVHLNGADNIRFRNMTVKTTNANYGWGFLINNAANNNIVENCTVDLSSGTSLSTALMGIVFSGSATSYSTSGNHSNNTIVQNNYIKGSATGGAYFGISNYGSFNTTENMNVSILNNRVENFYQYGIYAYYYSPNMIIRGNTISKPNRTAVTTFYGIYSIVGYGRIIDGNTITSPFGGAPTTTNTFYGIYSQNDGTTALPAVISNNLIHSAYGNGQMFGIYCASTYYASISHNTIVFDRDASNTNNTSTIYGVYSTGSTSASYPFDFKNNIIHITRSGGTRYGIYQASNPYYMASDNNNIYVNGTGSTNYIGFRGANQGTMAAWRTATGGDNNSVSLDALFTSASDYTPTLPAINNLGAASSSLYQMVSMDKNGLARKPSAPDMGCIEWTPICVGSDLVQGTPFQGTMRAGSLSDFDHLKAEDTVTFQIVPPTGYTNAGFGSTWTVENFSFKTVNGTAPGATDTASVMASASSAGSLWFSPDQMYTDSMYVLTFNIKSLSGAQECVSNFQRHVYVAPLPDPDFDTVGNCLGYPLTINNTSTILRGGMSYEWNFGDTTSNNTSTDFKPSYTFSRPGLFTVTLKATSNLGYSTTTTEQIEISYEPQPNFTATAACTGDSIFFTNTTTIGGPQVPLTYTWNFADGGATSNVKSPAKLYGAIGVYNVQLNASTAGGCNKSIFKNVTVFPRPTAAFTTTNACLGDNTSFTNGSTVTYGNIGNEWFFGDNTFSTDANPTKKYNTATTYSVKLRVYTEYGCRDSITKSVTVVAKPTADFATASFCDNDSTVFSNGSSANGGPALTYTWNFGDNSNSSSNASTLKHLYEDGNYTVVLNATNGSCSDSKQMQITIAEAPEASFMVNNTVCQGNATDFTNTSSNGSGTPSYSWMFGSSGTSAVKDPSYTFPGAGTFDVWLKVNSGSCSDSVKMAVTVNPNPVASFTFAYTSLVNQRQVNYTPTNSTYSTYLWNFGDGNNSNQLAPVYSYLSNGPFQVTLNVTDANGCVNTSAPQTVSFNVSAGQVMSKSFSFDVYPNPFRNQATIAYNLVKGGNVEVKLFDMTGKEIAVLANAAQNEGSYELSFSAAQYNLAAGTYFVRLSLNGEVQTKQIVQVK